MESTPEQSTQTPTGTSKEFLGGWDKVLQIGVLYSLAGIRSFQAGMAMAQGDSDHALRLGLAAGAFGVAGTLWGVYLNTKAPPKE